MCGSLDGWGTSFAFFQLTLSSCFLATVTGREFGIQTGKTVEYMKINNLVS